MTTPQSLLDEARLAKQGNYEIRTRFLTADGHPRFTNPLILQNSPYLLQHAHNPVYWYGWGEEAFTQARQDNKPVFLSIGYATCHWCHVMESESFDNEQVAAVLNREFVCIKLDREQRPDLDDLYMTALQLAGGHGGWPMSNFLTPDGKPFYSGTYFPADAFVQILEQIAALWRQQPAQLQEAADKLCEALTHQLRQRRRAAALDHAAIGKAVAGLLAMEDMADGGLGEAPKFPSEPNLLLLLDHWQRQSEQAEAAGRCLRRALDAMLCGGIYDQLGGGFHRYATDRQWRVPHFEKMLYNQGQLALLYARSWLICGDPEYRRVAEQTLDYALGELAAPVGCFYSASDADSDGGEGRYFTWTPAEVEAAVGQAEGDWLTALYGLTEAGNFEGRNVLYLPKPQSADADYAGLLRRLAPLRDALMAARRQRPAPFVDCKVITEWNALMINALVEGGQLFARADWIAAAERCAVFLWCHHRDESGQLYRNSLDEQASVVATLSDYGQLILAMISLFDVTGQRDWLNKAHQLQQRLTQDFWDPEEGGFFNTCAHHEGPLLVRSKAAYDGSSVSGNSVALLALVRLYQRTGEARLLQQIEQQLGFFAGVMIHHPVAFPGLLSALSEYRQPLPAAIVFGAQGHVRAEAQCCNGLLEVKVTIADGWQLAADEQQSLEDVLVSSDDQRPFGEYQSNLATGQPRQGIWRISCRCPVDDELANPLALLRIRACFQDFCLAEETLRLRWLDSS